MGDVVSKMWSQVGNPLVSIALANLIFSVRKEKAKDIVAHRFLTILDSSDYNKNGVAYSRFEPAEPRF